MKSTKAYSTGLKELRLKLGIKPPLAQTETDERATARGYGCPEIEEACLMSRSRRARNQGADFSWELGALKTEAASVNGLFLRRPLTIAHHLDGLLGPIYIRPHVGTAIAAS